MKKIYTVLFLFVCVVILQSGVKSVSNSFAPPTGYTGATGSYCLDCHGGFPLNNAGGNVTVTGLPSGGYTPNAAYNLSLQINHSAVNRRKWGFAMIAVNSSGASVGTFLSTNANAAITGSELRHNNAVSTANANTYTYNNLKWTAPATASGNVTFYYTGNAANGSGSGNDYIYAGSTVITLPIDLKEFKASTDNNNVVLKWQTASEINSNYFDVERSDDGQFFFSISKVIASGNSSLPVSYSFIDKKVSNNESQTFYRLKLVDKDGSFKYSNHLSVKPIIAGITIKNIYPTIIKTNDQIKVEILSNKATTMNIAVIDESGRKLQLLSTNLISGNNLIKFVPKSNNTRGMLFIQFSTTNFQQTKSLILQ